MMTYNIRVFIQKTEYERRVLYSTSEHDLNKWNGIRMDMCSQSLWGNCESVIKVSNDSFTAK